MEMQKLTSVRRGHTLVEILVVIGIVIMLAAIISTAGRAAIRASKVTVCSSNLSQLGKSLELYTSDHDGYIPPYFSYDGYDGGESVRYLHKARREGLGYLLLDV